jgi:hypothetical protein
MDTTPTEAQIQAFGQKIQAFAATLTADERAILETILRLAMGGEGGGEDVQGYEAVSTQQQQQQQTAQAQLITMITHILNTQNDMNKTIIRNVRG